MSDGKDFYAYEHSGRGYVSTEGELQNRFHTYEVKDDNPQRTAEEKEHILRIEAEKEKYMKQHGHETEAPKKEGGLLSKILPGKGHGDKDKHEHEHGSSHEHEHGHAHGHEGEKKEGLLKTLVHGNHDDEIGEDRREKDRAIDAENAKREAAAGESAGGSGGTLNATDHGLRTDEHGNILIHNTSSHPNDPVLVVGEQK